MSFHSLVDEDQASTEDLRWMDQNQGCFYAMCRTGRNDKLDGDLHAVLTQLFPPLDQIICINVPVELLKHLPCQQNYANFFEWCGDHHPELQLASLVERLKALGAEERRQAEKVRQSSSEKTSDEVEQHSHHRGERAGISARFATGD